MCVQCLTLINISPAADIRTERWVIQSIYIYSLSFPDMQDFSQLSSKTVTEVLMLEMKMSPQARAYLVSGFPRSMRDVVEYSEKVGGYIEGPA